MTFLFYKARPHLPLCSILFSVICSLFRVGWHKTVAIIIIISRVIIQPKFIFSMWLFMWQFRFVFCPLILLIHVVTTERVWKRTPTHVVVYSGYAIQFKKSSISHCLWSWEITCKLIPIYCCTPQTPTITETKQGLIRSGVHFARQHIINHNIIKIPL